MRGALRSIGRPTGVEWACLAGGLFLVLHYAWFLDDAFVYFRYADNAVLLGHGLVNNAGEYVEGFSSPLWMLILLGVRALGIDFWTAAQAVGVLSFVAFWAMIVALNRRLSPVGAPVVDVPLCYLAFNYAVLSYFTSGTESPLVQLAAPLYALHVLRPESRPLRLALAVTPLVRPELGLPFALCWLWNVIRERRVPLDLTLAGVAVNGAWLAFRIYYYADLFPNTFYLKDASDFAQGFVYLDDAVRPYHLPLLLATAVAALALLARRRRPDLAIGKRLLMAALAAAVGFYVVRIGGDARHYRFLAFPFCLLVCAIAGVAEHALASRGVPRARIAAALAGVALAALSASFYPAQLASHPLLGEPVHETRRGINDAALHRDNPELGVSAWQLRSRLAPRTVSGATGYTRISISPYCFRHYLALDQRALNYFGLTDAFLARSDVPYHRPGHKTKLWSLARDLATLYATPGFEPGRGALRRAVERGIAPRWIAENLDAIEVIERKIYNRHRLGENLALAFTFPPRIAPGPFK